MITNLRKLAETKRNKQGYKMWIIDFKNDSKILIQFETGGTRWSMYERFEKGSVTNPDMLIKNKIGAKFKDIEDKEIFRIWNAMILRCNGNYIKENRKSYENCRICKEWLDYNNFKEWYKENYYKVDNEIMHLDKDILVKGNKIYSPETCIFVPNSINTLFTKRQNDRGKYPIGVTYNKRNNKYLARCNEYILTDKKRVNLGYRNTQEEAFELYKIEKEKYIKQVADYYKDKIPQRLYDAMYRYEVEITD